MIDRQQSRHPQRAKQWHGLPPRGGLCTCCVELPGCQDRLCKQPILAPCTQPFQPPQNLLKAISDPSQDLSQIWQATCVPGHRRRNDSRIDMQGRFGLTRRGWRACAESDCPAAAAARQTAVPLERPSSPELPSASAAPLHPSAPCRGPPQKPPQSLMPHSLIRSSHRNFAAQLSLSMHQSKRCLFRDIRASRLQMQAGGRPKGAEGRVFKGG